MAGSIPPEHQLYRGLPGIHVTVRNPDEAEEAATGSISGHYHEVTIVETHTPDAPFIFESLKNFCQREGLRVFSAIHPIFTVRRQWERVTWIGGPADDGSRELFCQFRIERVEAREKLRRLEHQIYSLLKSVFLAVESYREMRRLTGELAGRLRARREGGDANTAKGFLNWMLDDNYVHLGMLRFRRGADGSLHPDQDAALGAFRDPALIATVFPGLNERLVAHIEPGADDDRIVDLDYCTNAYAIHHLEPIDDIVVREWAPDGTLAGATLLLGRLAKSAFATRAQDIPLLKSKLDELLASSGVLVNSHAYRETRAVFNYFPKRELLYSDVPSLKSIIDRMVYMAGDDDIAVTTRQGRGYAAALVAFSDARYSRKNEEDLRSGLARVFGPISFSTWADCGTTGVLVYYFDAATLERPLDVVTIREMTRTTITTWEDQAAIAIEQAFGPIEGRRLFKKYVRTESRSGMYRESTLPAEVPADLVRLEQLEGRLELSIIPLKAERAILKLYSPTPLSLTDTLRTLQNLKLGVTEELSIPLALPDGRTGYLSRLTVEAAPRLISAMMQGETRVLDAVRALHEQRATDCPLNGLVLLEGLAWRQVEVLRERPEPPAADPAALQRRHDQRRAAEEQRRGQGAVRPLRRALRPDADGAARPGDRQDRRGPARRLQDRRLAHRRRDPARHGEPAARRRADELLPAPGAAGHLDQGRERQGRGDGVAAAAVRDLRALAPPAGHPPADGQGRARRAALERSSRRLPHRDPRARQGPAGEERRHRPRRVEGRLRAEGQRANAAGAGQLPDRPLPAVHLGPARRDRQPRGRQGREPAGGRPPRRRRPVPGGGGRQGHGAPVGHRQQRVEPVPASGWATPSRRAAASATTTSGKASRRAARGSASSTTSACSATTSRPSRSPWRASATCPATCSATARC